MSSIVIIPILRCVAYYTSDVLKQLEPALLVSHELR